MAPNASIATGVLLESDVEILATDVPAEISKPENRKPQLVWRNIILFAYLHLLALFGFYLMFTSAKLFTSIQGNLSHFYAILRNSNRNINVLQLLYYINLEVLELRLERTDYGRIDLIKLNGNCVCF